MDKIIIKDLEVYAYHGVAEEEKVMGQLFIVSLELSADLEAAAQSDNLSHTIHYGEVCIDVEKVVAFQKYNLIEAVAMTVINKIFENYPTVQSIKISLKKPWAPIGKHLKYVAVELERSRENNDGK